MSDVIHVIMVLTLSFLLDRFLKPYPLRKWLGLLLIVAGAVGCVTASPTHLFGLDLGLLSALAPALGIGLFRRRRRFEPAG